MSPPFADWDHWICNGRREREREMKDGKVLKRMGWHMEVFMMVDRTGMLVLSKVKIELKNL